MPRNVARKASVRTVMGWCDGMTTEAYPEGRPRVE
jgi:hypothetical protein